MLSLGKLAPGQQQYYLDQIAAGAEEYYTGAKESPGQWMGRSVARLGLDGEVDAQDLHRLLDHRDPTTDLRLTDGRSVPRVAGFDATFCAPKSVSLLFALGAPEVSNEVRNAHDAAVTDALTILEDEAARARRDRGGARVIEAEGLAAAAFRHRTSRAGDPQLHTHVVVANLVHSPEDRRWSALDARPLYRWAKSVGHLYEAQLRSEMTRRLGVEWGAVRNGIADVAGVPRNAIREFSTRRREIEAHLVEHGESSARAAQVAAYATRRPKDETTPVEGLLPGWRARAKAVGLDAERLAAVVDRAAPSVPATPDSAEAAELYARLASADGLTANRSTFDRRDVIIAVCNALPQGGQVREVLALTQGFLASEHVIALGRPGRDPRWTTPEMVAVEQSLLSSAARRQVERKALVPHRAIGSVFAERPYLSSEQKRMVRDVCRSTAGIQVVVGAAGAGKTAALAAANDAWGRAGWRVRGAALAARAAAELEAGSGIPSTTLDRLLSSVRYGDALGPRDLVVVDEAGMVGTRKLAQLAARAEMAGARLVLVGDPYQLPEIEAGGALAGMARRLGASELTGNRRQREDWERRALAELRLGDPDEAMAAYRAHGRVHAGVNGEDVREQLVADWFGARGRGQRTLMLAGRLSEVDDLNQRARALLRAAGGLGAEELAIGGRAFAVGDEVLALRNDYRLGLLNGTRARVLGIDEAQRRFLMRTDEDQLMAVPFAYAEEGHLTHSYAMTIHKSQGSTVDRCLVLADDTLAREHIYTAMSRGTASNDLYMAADDDLRIEDRHAVEVASASTDRLRRSVSRRGAQRMALDEGGAELVPIEVLRAERERLAHSLADRPRNPTRQLAELEAKIRSTRGQREDAAGRKGQAETDLASLGPLGRGLLRRGQRQEYERNLAQAVAQEQSASTDLSTLASAHRRLQPDLKAWKAWQRDHAVEIERESDLTRAIREHERSRVAERSASRSRGFGIEL